MKYTVLFLIGFCILFSGCEKNDPEEIVNRTVLVYIARDNNLNGSGEDKITAMLEGWNGKNGNLIFYQDLKNESPCLMEAYREGNETKSRIVETYEEENSASAEVFGRVIKDVITQYPSDSYGLIIFTHGTGWLPEGTFSQPRSIGADGNDEMELIDFANAIPRSAFDFIAFELCLMAGAEVIYELKDKTPLILASAAEIVSPGFREIYRTEMNRFFTKQPDLVGFAEKAYEWVESQTSDVYRSGTLSIINTQAIGPLANWLKNNITREYEGSLSDLQPFDRRSPHLFYDFEDYFSYRVPENKKAELTSLVDDCIVYKAATDKFFSGNYSGGFIIEKHSGLTTYIIQKSYPYLNEYYKNLSWYKAVFE